MNAATWPRPRTGRERLLHIERASGRFRDRTVRELAALLRAGDVIVVNDAATLPASLHGHAREHGPIELRLLGEAAAGTWTVVLFSQGDWRTPTERRTPAPRLAPGAELRFGELSAEVQSVSPESPRLLLVRFNLEGAAFWSALYRVGRPVQYAYLNGPLELWHVQNRYAARPWAVEAPSAGFALSGERLAELRRAGVHITALTHAAGLSSTGDAALDARLPLGERYHIPEDCAERVTVARRAGRRVIAAGTSVVRALESAHSAGAGRVVAGDGYTELRITAAHRLRSVDGLLTGIHDPSASHHALLEAFCSRETLERAHALAEASGYLEHEFGDFCLVL